jgi:hypothetical protein
MRSPFSLFANNPTLCAYVKALDIWGPDTEIVVCSLGTGQKRERQLTKAEVDTWGLAKWATTILDTAFDGVSDSVDYYIGRQRLLFAVESDAHRGLLEGWRLAAFPPNHPARSNAIEQLTLAAPARSADRPAS